MYLYRTDEPAPLGIADYGVSQAGFYRYNTNDSLGTATILSLQTLNSTGDRRVSLQLNVVLAFTDNNVLYVYWIQDVAQLNTATNRIEFLDNIWNFTSTLSNMNAAGVSGNGNFATANGVGFYYDSASSTLEGNGLVLSYPATVSFLLSTGTNPLGQPFVRFQYDDGFGFKTYDTVTFKVDALTSFSGFVVDGNQYTPRGLFYDSELVLGGVGSGWQTADLKSDVRLKLSYWNGHNYETIPSSFNFGSNTAEGISNVQSLGYYSHDTGSLFVEVLAGNGSLTPAFDQSQVGTIDILSGLSSGTLTVSNATSAVSPPDKYSFVNGEVAVTLYPGVYLLRLYQGTAIYDEGTVTVSPGRMLPLQTPLGDIQMIMSYSFHGGHPASSPPTLTYFHAGMLLQVPLTTSPTTYYMDPGTTWNTSGNVTGQAERWATNQPTSGVASSYQSIEFAFYHQFLLSFDYAVVGGGTGYSSPSIAFSQFGTAESTPLGSSVWADAGSVCQFTEPLAGSTQVERWSSNSVSASVGGAGILKAVYYHQFPLAISYSVVGGGPPSGPSLGGTQYGASVTYPIATQGGITWLDSGASWSITNPLGGSAATERWQTDSSTTGGGVGASKVSVVYYHQYLLALSYAVPLDGTPPAPQASGVQFGKQFSLTMGGQPAFFDSGTPVHLSATAAANWKFEGWSGSGNGAYSGPLNQTSILTNGPIAEKANYYTGLTITAGSNGDVAYSYFTTSGTVRAGTTLTVYAPEGSVVSLSAKPSSILYQFAGWSPASAGSSGQSTLTLGSPSAVNASFSINRLTLGGGIGALVIAVSAVAIFALRRRSKSSKPKESTPAWLEPLRKSQPPSP